MGKNGDLAVLVLEDSSEGGGLLLGEVLEAVGDVEGDVGADAGLRGDSLLAEAEVGNEGLWLKLKLDVLVTAGGIDLGLAGSLAEGDPPVLEGRGGVLGG